MTIINRTLYSAFAIVLALAVAACTQTPKDQVSEAPTEEQEQDTTTEAVNSEMATLRALAMEAEPPEDVYLLGWSDDGKMLAYRSFYLSDAISRHAEIKIEVVDIVSDKVLWDFSRKWDEGNSAEDGTESSPTNGGEAWAIVVNAVGADLARFEIMARDNPDEHDSYGTFPFGGDIVAYDAGLEVSSDDNSYKVIATNSEKGEKTLLQKQREPGDFSEASIVGYFMNHQSNRIAIIVKEVPQNPVVNFYVTGCSMNTGFKMAEN